MEATHASFFSGVGGLDMGLERAGWRTVSFSEIDPYACAVLAQRWPGVPNLGDITTVRGSDVGAATLWTGGFPCQDLSVAGKRRGMGAGTRSSLAFAFLELAAVHRPRFILLENVPGLLSSHRGRDMAALLGALVELGYGVGYRVLDARYFGVPQRRRRVFILGVSSGGRAGAECAAEVLSVGSRCHWHPPTGVEAGEGTASGAYDGPDIVGTVPAGLGHHGQSGYSSQAVGAGHVIPVNGVWNATTGPSLTTSQERHEHPGDVSYVVSASPDPGRVRASDGLAGRLDDRVGVADTLNSGGNNGGFRTEPGAHLTLGGDVSDDPLLPLGLDSHRYRCCGNGVVSDVAEWIGHRLAMHLKGTVTNG